MMSTLQTGRIGYLAKGGGLRGAEPFSITIEDSGCLIGRSHAYTFDSRFSRDALVSWTPERDLLEAHVQLRVAERHIGSGYFTQRDGIIRGVADMPGGGRVEQVVAIKRPYTFVTHAVAFDAWHYFQYDRAAGGRQRITAYNTSTRWNGTDGPIGALQHNWIEYLGDERITVQAGTFKAERWQLDSGDPEKGVLAVWALPGSNAFVKLDWTLGYVYELLNFEERELPGG
jgi:hypothetical protein